MYWHNMTLLEQTDILGRRPVCVFVCVHILCVCVCVCVCVCFMEGGSPL